jgi:hypothetical protein
VLGSVFVFLLLISAGNEEGSHEEEVSASRGGVEDQQDGAVSFQLTLTWLLTSRFWHYMI